jgi:hypothetical protein
MQLSRTSFVDRIIGALRLDPATYEEIEHDSDGTGQAAIIVVVVAILSGIGAYNRGVGALISAAVAALIAWAIYSFAVYIVGTTILKSPETSASFEEVLRTLGFAYAPSAFAILGLIPGIGGILSFLAGIWALVASIIAIRQSLEVTTGRAVAIAIVAVIVLAIIAAIIAAIFGIALYAGIQSMAPRT